MREESVGASYVGASMRVWEWLYTTVCACMCVSRHVSHGVRRCESDVLFDMHHMGRTHSNNPRGDIPCSGYHSWPWHVYVMFNGCIQHEVSRTHLYDFPVSFILHPDCISKFIKLFGNSQNILRILRVKSFWEFAKKTPKIESLFAKFALFANSQKLTLGLRDSTEEREETEEDTDTDSVGILYWRHGVFREGRWPSHQSSEFQ